MLFKNRHPKTNAYLKKLIDQTIDMLLEHNPNITPEEFNERLTVIGHRGVGPVSKYYAGRALPEDEIPENSLLAFEHALLNGAKGVELDVFVTKDGHVVVVHDDPLAFNVDGYHQPVNAKQLEESTDLEDKKLLVSGLTLQELQEYYPIGTGQYVPTLNETIDLFLDMPDDLKDKDFCINVEIQAKDYWPEERKRAQVEATFKVIWDKILSSKGKLDFSNFLITSFDEYSLTYMRQLCKKHDKKQKHGHLRMVLGILTKKLYGGNDELGPNWVPIERNGPEALQKNGLYKIKHDVDTNYLEETLTRLKKNGIDGLDMTSCDMQASVIEACKRKGMFLTACIHDTRALSQVVLEHPDILDESLSEYSSSESESIGKQFFGDDANSSEQKKVTSSLTLYQYGEEDEKPISREDLEIIETMKMLSLSVSHNTPIIYKADNVRLAKEVLSEFQSEFQNRKRKRKEDLFFTPQKPLKPSDKKTRTMNKIDNEITDQFSSDAPIPSSVNMDVKTNQTESNKNRTKKKK